MFNVILGRRNSIYIIMYITLVTRLLLYLYDVYETHLSALKDLTVSLLDLLQ